jgi:hypothetical protein
MVFEDVRRRACRSDIFSARARIPGLLIPDDVELSVKKTGK